MYGEVTVVRNAAVIYPVSENLQVVSSPDQKCAASCVSLQLWTTTNKRLLFKKGSCEKFCSIDCTITNIPWVGDKMMLPQCRLCRMWVTKYMHESRGRSCINEAVDVVRKFLVPWSIFPLWSLKWYSNENLSFVHCYTAALILKLPT